MLNIFKFFFKQKNNISTIAIEYLKLLSVKISKQKIIKEIEEHPNFPSLFCLSDVFNNCGLKNITAEFEDFHFFNLTTPFITQVRGLKREINYFTIVKNISKNDIQYFDPEINKWKLISKEQFIQRTNKTVFLVDHEVYFEDPKYLSSLFEEKKNNLLKYFILSLYPFVFICNIIYELYRGVSVLPILYSFINFIGVVVCIFLWVLELDKNNSIVTEICNSNKIKNANCNAVVNSKGSKIFGINWSVLGLSYFIGLHYIYMLNGISNSKNLFILSLVTFLVTPYIFFSILYQWKVIKHWCILCLIVQTVLFSQFLIVLNGDWFTLNYISNIESKDLLLFVIPFITTFVIFIILYELLLNHKKYRILSNSFQRFKRNKKVFSSILFDQKLLNNEPKGLGLIFGNPNAKYKILKVCSPYCEPCSKAHIEIENILNNNSDIEVQVIYNILNLDSDPKLPTVKHFLSLDDDRNSEKLKSAMNYWYSMENKEFSELEKLFPIVNNESNVDFQIQAMYNWCKMVDITFTPTIFIGQFETSSNSYKYYQYPSLYKIRDLKYFFSI